MTYTITYLKPKCNCPPEKPLKFNIEEFPHTCRCGTKYTSFYKNKREDGVEIGSQYCVPCCRWNPFTMKDQFWYVGTLPMWHREDSLLEKRITMINKKKKSGKGKKLRQAKHKLEALKNRVGGARQRTLKRQEKRINRLQIDLEKRNK